MTEPRKELPEEPRTKPPRRRWKWLRRGLVGLLVLVVLIVAAVLTLTKTDFGRNQVRKQVLSLVAEYVNGTIELEAIDGDLLGDFTLKTLAIRDPKGNAAISAESLRIKYHLAGLFDQALKIDALHLERLDLSLAVDESGQLNLATLFVPPPPDPDAGPSPWTVVVNDLWIDRARIDLAAVAPEIGVVENLTLRGRASIIGDNIVLELSEVRAELPALEQTLEGNLALASTGTRLDGNLALTGQGVSVRIPAAMLHSEPAALVAAVLVHIEPALGNRLVPDLGLLVPTDLSLMVTSSDLREFAGSVGVSAGTSRVTVLGKVDLDSGALSAGAAIGPTDPGTIVASAPAIKTRGLRVSGVVDAKAQFEGVAAGLVSAFGVAEQRIDIDLGGQPTLITGTIDSRGAGAKIHVKGGIDLKDEPMLLATDVTARIPNLSRLLGRRVPARGSVYAKLTTSGRLDALGLRGDVSVSGAAAEGVSAQRLNVSLRARGIPSAPRGSFTLEAKTVQLGDERLDWVRSAATIDERGNVGATVAVSGVNATLKTRVSGSLDAERIKLRIRELGGRFKTLRAKGAGGSLDISYDGDVRVKGVEVAVAGGTLNLDAKVTPTIRGSQVSAAVEIAKVDVAELAKLFGKVNGLAGQLDLTTRIDLGPRKNSADLDMSLTGHYRDFPSLTSKAKLVLRRRRLAATFDSELGRGLVKSRVEGVFTTPRNPTDAVAWNRLGRRAIDQLDASVVVADVGRLARWLPDLPLIGGRIALEAKSDGSTVSAELTGTGLQNLWTTAKTDARLAAVLDGRTIDVQGGIEAADLGKIKIAGELGTPANALDMAAWRRASLASIQRFRVDVDQVWPNKSLWSSLGVAEPPKGRLDGSVELRGGSREVDVDMKLAGFKTGPMTKSATARVHVAGRPKDVSASVELGLGRRTLARTRGRIAFGLDNVVKGEWENLRKAKLEVSATSEPIELKQLFAAFGLGQVLGGTVALEAKVDGSYAEPRGFAELGITKARYEKVELAKATARVTATKKDLRVALHAKQVGGGKLDLDLRTDLNKAEPSRELRLAAKDFEIGLLASLGPPSVRGVGGRLYSDLVLRGKGDRMGIARGKVALRKGTVSLSGPLRRLSNIDLVLRSNFGYFSVALTARAGEGRINVQSSIKLKGIVPESVSGTIKLKRLPLATAAGIMEVSLDAKLEAEDFQPKEPYLDVEITDGLITMPRGTGRDFHAIGAPTDVVFVESLEKGIMDRKEVAKAPVPPFLLTVSIPRTLQLRGEQINGVIEAELDLTFHKGQVEYLGHAELQRGWVKIFRHRYEIERAHADLEAVKEFNPRVDIKLVKEFKTAVFSVIMKGYLNDPPKPQFSAEPALYDEAQLISFFLGGSPDDINRNRAPSSRAASAATSLVTSRLTNIVQELIPVIDVLKLETSGNSATPDQLLAGKWLTDKVMLAYRARLSESDRRSNINEATVEWWFLRRWLLQVFYGDSNVGAADVLWIRRF